MWNQIYSNGVNDDVNQRLDTIYWIHNVDTPTCKLKSRWQKNMGLFTKNVKTRIPDDKRKGIPHNIMGSYLLPTMGQWRKWIPIRFKSLPQMQCDKQELRGKGGPTKCTMQWTKLLKSIKKKDHWVNKQPHTCTLSSTRSHTCSMQIKKQTKNDVRKIMVKQSFWNNLLKLIGFSLFNCSQWGTHHHH
jgi:hypothetical protein